MNTPPTTIAKICIGAFLFFAAVFPVSAQSTCRLCEAVNAGRFNKAEKIVKKEILKYKYGKTITNGNTSYPSYREAFDSIVSWLNKKECVAAATWDKCQSKIMLYPGHSTIGAVFKTPNGEVEKTFLLREGKIRNINRWLGWLHHFKSKERFYYLRMKDTKGFVKQQLELCREEEKRYEAKVVKRDTLDFNFIDTSSKEELIPYQDLLGTFVSVDLESGSDTLTFTLKEKYHAVTLTRTAEKRAEYWFGSKQEQMITSIGTYSPWHIQLAKVENLSPDSIKVLYSNSYDFKGAKAIIYHKLQ